VTRLIGLLVAAGFTFWLLWHAEERAGCVPLALSLILFVELGPVVQPWYSRGSHAARRELQGS